MWKDRKAQHVFSVFSIIMSWWFWFPWLAAVCWHSRVAEDWCTACTIWNVNLKGPNAVWNKSNICALALCKLWSWHISTSAVPSSPPPSSPPKPQPLLQKSMGLWRRLGEISHAENMEYSSDARSSHTGPIDWSGCVCASCWGSRRLYQDLWHWHCCPFWLVGLKWHLFFVARWISYKFSSAHAFCLFHFFLFFHPKKMEAQPPCPSVISVQKHYLQPSYRVFTTLCTATLRRFVRVIFVAHLVSRCLRLFHFHPARPPCSTVNAFSNSGSQTSAGWLVAAAESSCAETTAPEEEHSN